MNKKHWATRMRFWLENVAVGTFILVGSLIFVVAGAVALTIVWLYTRD